jgi:hypothetical protein
MSVKHSIPILFKNDLLNLIDFDCDTGGTLLDLQAIQ